MGRPVMLITGGSRGIGAACAVMAAERGYDVAISYASASDAAAEVVSRCHRAGAHAIAVRCDVAIETEVLDLFAACRGELGPPAVVVNNAGILHEATRFDEIDVDRLREVVDVNVIGAFVVAREAARAMSTHYGGVGGSIVNVSSAASYLGSPNEYVDYAATKGALDTLTIGLSKELADEGVRVNAVRPGLIRTDIHLSSGIPDRVDRLAPNVPMQRGGEADEVAEAVLWLASDSASYVTGVLLNCSGGR